MKKKIIVISIIIILLLELIIPFKVNASSEVSPTTGLDTKTGVIMEPTIEFITVIIDAIMEVFTKCMTQGEFEFVMVDKVEEIHEMSGEAGAMQTIDMKPYENVFGVVDIKYPNFSYSAEEIFSGNIDLLDINFIDNSNGNSGWNKVRNVIASWYKVLRMIAIIGLLSVLIYTGIKIIISSSSKDKAKYKERILNWFIAVILLFSLQYIMAFILIVVEKIMELLGGINGIIEVNAGGTIFKTNLIGLARFQMQQQHFSAKIGHLIIYVALVVFTFKFTFVYLKRVLNMAFLTLISPIVALTYPIDKMDGQAKGFNMWLKEYIFNALLQPLHYILYYILVSSSLTLAARNPIYGIAAVLFISEAEKLLKRIFGFDKARGGMVGGVAGAFTTGAIVSSLTKLVKNPLHPFGGNGSGNKDGSSSNNLNDGNIKPTIEDSEIEAFLDTNITALPTEVRNGDNIQTQVQLSLKDIMSRYRGNLANLSIDELGGIAFGDEDIRRIEDVLSQIAQYQMQLKGGGISPEEEQTLYEKIRELKNMLRNTALASEIRFSSNEIPFMYNDRDSRTTTGLIDELIKLMEWSNDTGRSQAERQQYAQQAEGILEILKRRMAENSYIERQGGPEAIIEEEIRNNGGLSNPVNTDFPIFTGFGASFPINADGTNARNVDAAGSRTGRRINPPHRTTTGFSNVSQQNSQERQQSPNTSIPNGAQGQATNEGEDELRQDLLSKFSRGVGNVGKTIAKPVWDAEKSDKENVTRLAGNIVKGAVGASVGITAAAVQAGISITDGKYNPMEGIATFGAGMVGASKLGSGSRGLREAYKQGAYEGDDGKAMKDYSEQWYNRDDVIRSYNNEFPGKGKQMRERAVRNYLTRGIVDFEEQKQAMKFAEQLKRERGMSEDEADRLAIATLQYKQELLGSRTYMVLYDKQKRTKYLDARVESYRGAASSDAIRRLHNDFIENVADFDRANK